MAGDSGLQFISLYNRKAPVAERFLRLSSPALDVVLDDTLCDVANDIGGVVLVNVANAYYPWIAAYYGAPSRVSALAVNSGKPVAVDVYSGGRDQTEVIAYRVEGGGHTWPGGSERTARFGKQSRDINASETIWEFFQAHSRPVRANSETDLRR